MNHAVIHPADRQEVQRHSIHIQSLVQKIIKRWSNSHIVNKLPQNFVRFFRQFIDGRNLRGNLNGLVDIGNIFLSKANMVRLVRWPYFN